MPLGRSQLTILLILRKNCKVIILYEKIVKIVWSKMGNYNTCQSYADFGGSSLLKGKRNFFDPSETRQLIIIHTKVIFN